MDDFFRFSGDGISMGFSYDKHPKSENFYMHTHENYELYYFVNGKGTFRIEGSAYELESGDILIMRPAESHYIDIDPEHSYTRMTINFDEKILAAIDPELALLQPFNKRDSGRLNLYRSQDFKDQSYRIFINNIITNTDNKRMQTITNLFPLLNEILIAFRSGNGDNEIDTLSYKIVSYINAGLTRNISLDEICSEFYIGKPKLCRMFKAATGSTVWDYITVKRLVFARQLIRSGTPATKAYSECGYNDYSAFYRAYRKYYGVSPAKIT